jgi:hypothetical protein
MNSATVSRNYSGRDEHGDEKLGVQSREAGICLSSVRPGGGEGVEPGQFQEPITAALCHHVPLPDSSHSGCARGRGCETKQFSSFFSEK